MSRISGSELCSCPGTKVLGVEEKLAVGRGLTGRWRQQTPAHRASMQLPADAGAPMSHADEEPGSELVCDFPFYSPALVPCLRASERRAGQGIVARQVDAADLG